MRHCRRQLVPVLALAILAAPAVAGWSESIPRLSARTLSGGTVVLPDDLAAGVTILVVGFTRKAGDNTRPWVERLRRDFTPAEGFTVYSVAVIAGVPALFRPLAAGAIRGSVPPADRATFLIADQDESAWRLLAGYQAPDTPYIVAMDKSGAVLARAGGPYDEETYAEAAARIRSGAAQKE